MRKYVNRSLFLATLGILLGFSSTSAFAQIATKVAYVSKDRDKIYVTKGDGKSEVLFPAQQEVTAKNLALIGSTTDGKSIIIAGTFTIKGLPLLPINDFSAIIRIDSPYTVKGTPPFNFEVLYVIGDPSAKADQIGMITQDNQQWYATWTGSSQGGEVDLKFFHGKVYPTSGDVVDSASDNFGNPFKTQGEFHMTNITATPDGSQMFAISVDKLEQGSSAGSVFLHKWKPKVSYNISEFSSAVTKKFDVGPADSAMGFALYATQDYIFAAFSTKDNSLAFYRFPIVTSDQPKFNSAAETGIAVPRSALPDSLVWFRGEEVDIIPQNAMVRGTGADIGFYPGKDKFLVTVHEADPVHINERNRYSQIWEVDIDAGTAKQMVDDPNISERTPKYFFYDQHTPVKVDSGYISIGVTSLDFGTTDIGKTTTKQITVTNPSGRAVTLNSATVTGAGYSIVSNSKGINPPFTVGVEESVNFNITFQPTAAGNANGTFTVKFASSNDSTRSASLTGVATIPVDGVRLPNAAAINLTVSPNPFKQSTLITLTAQETGNTTFEVTDVMGRVVFSAPVVKLAKGESRSFEFNAQQLNVPVGVYHVSAVSAGQTLTRQIVYVK